MARTRKFSYDSEHTEILAQAELFVEKVLPSNDIYIVRSHSLPPECCPLCRGTSLKTHRNFKKYYVDYLPENKRPVTLEYNFYKYRCLNPECRHIFSNPISFAATNDHVTHRLEEQIGKWVIAGNTYDKIADLLSDQVTRPAVGQIFNRWVTRKEWQRQLSVPPSKIGMISGSLNGGDAAYILFLSLDDGIRILDILYNAGSADIIQKLRQVGHSNIRFLFSDCNPIITTAIHDAFPNIPHVVPVSYWFQMVTADFQLFSHDILKWSPVPDKYNLITIPPGSLGLRQDSLKTLLLSRPDIEIPYKAFNRLRTIITRRDEMWIFQELEDWVGSLDPSFRDGLAPSIMLLQQLRQPIEQQIQYRDELPERLFIATSTLEHILNQEHFRTFSEELLKARVLYSTENNLKNWIGVPIDDVITALRANPGNTEE